MAKASGGTRNYSRNLKVMTSRRSEYEGLLATGLYDVTRSAFDNSGGFYITHKEHDRVSNPEEDKSDIAVSFLAMKGYRVYLDSERTTISDNGKKRDGRIEKSPMEIKTINKAGKSTVKNNIEDAAKQNARTVILYQNTPKADVKYIKEQIYGENGFIMKSPKKVVNQIDWVIVVGSNGHVHRHNIMEERSKRK